MGFRSPTSVDGCTASLILPPVHYKLQAHCVPPNTARSLHCSTQGRDPFPRPEAEATME